MSVFTNDIARDIEQKKSVGKYPTKIRMNSNMFNELKAQNSLNTYTKHVPTDVPTFMGLVITIDESLFDGQFEVS